MSEEGPKILSGVSVDENGEIVGEGMVVGMKSYEMLVDMYAALYKATGAGLMQVAQERGIDYADLRSAIENKIEDFQLGDLKYINKEQPRRGE